MEVEDVDRRISTIVRLHFHVLTHPIVMIPTEWTSQRRALQYLNRRNPDDACVMALMRHIKARAAAAAHHREPLLYKADVDFPALTEHNHVSNFMSHGLPKVLVQRLFVPLSVG